MRDSGLRVGISGLGRLGKRHAQSLAYKIRGARLVAARSLRPSWRGYFPIANSSSERVGNFYERFSEAFLAEA